MAALRVAPFEAPSTCSSSPEFQFPSIAPVPPQPWENLCKDDRLNPHQFIAISTAIGEELHPYIGDIFSIPSAGHLLWEPPAFPSVFPFFTVVYHKQSFIPAPTVVSGLSAGAQPTLVACAKAICTQPTPDIPLGYIRFTYQQGIKEMFARIPPLCWEPYRHHVVFLDHFDFLNGRTISVFGYLDFEGRHIFVRRQTYHFEDLLRHWPSLTSFILAPRLPFNPLGITPVIPDNHPL